MSKTPHESVHYLSRDEIAGLRIDPREFQETGWMLMQSRRVSIRKLFIEARGPERKEYRIGLVDLSCAAPGRTGLIYVRGLASDEASRAQALGLVVDGKEIPMTGIAAVSKLDFLDTGSSFDRWGRSDARDFLERVTKVDNFAIAAGSARPAARARERHEAIDRGPVQRHRHAAREVRHRRSARKSAGKHATPIRYNAKRPRGSTR